MDGLKLHASGRKNAARVPLLLDPKRMDVHDGPGIWTTFLAKGCPLKCL